MFDPIVIQAAAFLTLFKICMGTFPLLNKESFPLFHLSVKRNAVSPVLMNYLYNISTQACYVSAFSKMGDIRFHGSSREPAGRANGRKARLDF